MNGHTDAIAHGIVPDTDHDNAFIAEALIAELNKEKS